MSTKGLLRAPCRRASSLLRAKRDLLAHAARQFAHGTASLDDVERAADEVRKAREENPRSEWR